MGTVQIQLPPTLVRRIQQEVSSDEVLSQVVTEAIQMWLERRWEEKGRKKALQALRRTGVIMASERQRNLAEIMMVALPMEEVPTRAQVEDSLATLKVPLSEEIIAMRGER